MGKITQNTGKLQEFEIILFDIFSDIEMNCVVFARMGQGFSKENKTFKKYWKIGKKILEKSGILSVPKGGNHASQCKMRISPPPFRKIASQIWACILYLSRKLREIYGRDVSTWYTGLKL